MIAALLAVLGPILGDAVRRVLPDQGEAARVTGELQTALIANAGAIQDAAGKIVLAEVSNGSWLGRSWRPITMLVFVALIVSRWLGWANPELSAAELLELWEIVKIGLGGYIGGRTVEKLAPVVAAAVRRGS